MLWPVDADEIAFVTPLYVDAGRRVREEAEMVGRSEDANLERDASLLFAMPMDDLPDEEEPIEMLLSDNAVVSTLERNAETVSTLEVFYSRR